MIHDILANAENVDVVRIIDTDSLFIQLKDFTDLHESISSVEEYINGEMMSFMDMHNMNRTDMIRMRLKNEFYLPRLIAFSKKRYIGATYDFVKKKKKVEIRGIEGRRATTKFILEIVSHLQKYIEQDDDNIDLKTIFYDVFKKIEYSFSKFNIDYIGMPINPPKNFAELKSVQSPARGMINFDTLVTPVFSKMYTKGLYFPIYISESMLSSSPDLMKRCKAVLKAYSKFPSIKLERKKKDTDESYYARFVKDITVPEVMMNSKTMDDLVKIGIRIDFVSILKTFFKKFILLFSPVFENDPTFDFLAECEKTYQYVVKTYYDV